MRVFRPAPRSPIQSPLISQPRPSPYLRGVNFRAATGSRLVDIPVHSSHKPLPSSCIFTRPCCRLIHQQEIYTCMLDTHCASTFYAALLFPLFSSFFFLFFLLFFPSSPSLSVSTKRHFSCGLRNLPTYFSFFFLPPVNLPLVELISSPFVPREFLVLA